MGRVIPGMEKGLITGLEGLVEILPKSVLFLFFLQAALLTEFLICHLSSASLSVPPPVMNLFALIRKHRFIMSCWSSTEF